MTDTLSTAPGIALKTLFRNAKDAELRKLIDPSILDTMQGLNPDLISGNHLSKFVENLIDPSQALRDTQICKQIIRMLPLPKARELGQRLGIKQQSTLYKDLCTKAAEKSVIEILESFFGVVRDVRAPTENSSDLVRVQADYSLFDHQRLAAERVMKALTNPPRKILLHMPTGSGKTRTAMHIVATHLRQHAPTVVCWLAYSSELLDQAAEELIEAWRFLGNREIDILRFWGPRKPNVLNIHDGVIVSGLGKMAILDNRHPTTMLRLADRVSLTIIDEAHQAIAPTYASVLTTLHSKRPHNALLGLTATPGRSWSDIAEDRKLSEYFDEQKVSLEVDGYSDPVTFLIDKKYLARPIFHTLNSDAGLQLNDDDVRTLSSAIDIPTGILDRLGMDTKRNLKVLSAVEDLLTRHRRILVFAPSVENARILSSLLTLRGHEASVVTGKSTASERERIIRRFRSSNQTPMVIFNYGVLTTGFDAPATSAAIIARPTRSLILYSQMVGRATRGARAGGNNQAEIITVVDPHLPGFGSIADAFKNWEDVWNDVN